MSILSQLREQGSITAFNFHQQVLIADARGALFWPSERTLVVSDLHLEKGSYFHRFAHPIPGYDSAETLRKLGNLIDIYQPLRVVCLGDSFHDRQGAHRLADELVDQLLDWSKSFEWLWILGNHDPEVPEWLGGIAVEQWQLNNILFCHEPSMTTEAQVFGHFHPKHRIRIASRRITDKCFVYTADKILMPSFGAYTGGLDTDDEAISGLWAKGDRVSTLLCHQDKIWRVQ